jgi:2-iminobutanoate/2-iminopropanoate deaminase
VATWSIPRARSPCWLTVRWSQVLANLEAVLKEAGASLNSVIKTTVFVQDLADFGTLNSLYEAAFGDHKPARSTVQVARLPRDVLVEIEAIAKI